MSISGITGLSNSYMMGINSFDKNLTKSQNLQKKVENENVEDKELMDACKTFEGYFLQMMYKSMRNTIDTSNSFMPQSNAEKIFQDMLDEETCKNASSSGNGIGLAQMLYKQLSRQHKTININGE